MINRIIPPLCLIIVTIAIISLLMLNCRKSEYTEPSLQDIYDEYRLLEEKVLEFIYGRPVLVKVTELRAPTL